MSLVSEHRLVSSHPVTSMALWLVRQRVRAGRQSRLAMRRLVRRPGAARPHGVTINHAEKYLAQL